MNPLHEPVGAAEFKARCLQIMDQVKETGAEVTITKHGHPVAKLVPIAAQVARPPPPRLLQGLSHHPRRGRPRSLDGG